MSACMCIICQAEPSDFVRAEWRRKLLDGTLTPEQFYDRIHRQPRVTITTTNNTKEDPHGSR